MESCWFICLVVHNEQLLSLWYAHTVQTWQVFIVEAQVAKRDTIYSRLRVESPPTVTERKKNHHITTRILLRDTINHKFSPATLPTLLLTKTQDTTKNIQIFPPGRKNRGVSSNLPLTIRTNISAPVPASASWIEEYGQVGILCARMDQRWRCGGVVREVDKVSCLESAGDYWLRFAFSHT